MTVEAIKEAISELPENERHSLAAWLMELQFDDWDKQMLNDFSPGGRGAQLAQRVKRDIAAGKTRSFEEGRRDSSKFCP